MFFFPFANGNFPFAKIWAEPGRRRVGLRAGWDERRRRKGREGKGRRKEKSRGKERKRRERKGEKGEKIEGRKLVVNFLWELN